jgi:hypothetical protein
MIWVMQFILNGKLKQYFTNIWKNNIIDNIKDFIEIALSNPYTHKIKILDIHVKTR